jgi:hypothetical protein
MHVVDRALHAGFLSNQYEKLLVAELNLFALKSQRQTLNEKKYHLKIRPYFFESVVECRQL